MHKVRTNNILFQQDLVLDMYLIGYKTKGESIIFIIYTDGVVAYSGVVDCYEYNNLNKTVEILSNRSIKKLNFICWTHPDEDHSIGIDKLIKNYSNEKTKVYLPGHITGEEYKYNERIKKTFDMINNNIGSSKRRKYSVYEVSDNQILEYKNLIRGSSEQYEFNIKSIAPNSMILRKDDNNSSFKKNDYSIGFILNLGEFNCLLSGDIENKTITKIQDFYMPNFFDCIKVPHHTSDTSSKLLNYLDYENKCEIACTTVFRSQGLPKRSLMQEYSRYSNEFYSTGRLTCEDIEDYGIINIKCNIIKRKIETKLLGNSEKIFNK